MPHVGIEAIGHDASPVGWWYAVTVIDYYSRYLLGLHPTSIARGDSLERDDLPAEISGVEAAPPSATLNLEEMERRTILQALKEAGGNKTRAASVLGIYPSSLYKKMRRFGLPLG